MDDLDDHNLPPDYMPGGTDGGRWLEIMRIHGSGTLPGLLDVIRDQLMAGNGIRFATDSWDGSPPPTRASIFPANLAPRKRLLCCLLWAATPAANLLQIRA